MSSSQRTKLNHVNIKYLLSLFGICDLVEFSILKVAQKIPITIFKPDQEYLL